MNYWLVKTEPGEYSWDDFVKLKRDHWDGVRNYAARLHLKNMQKDDLVFFYHSVKQKEIVGICKVVKEHYQDPTTDDDRWVAVDFVPVKPLVKPVHLSDIKANPKLQEIALVKISRLSVMPIDKAHWKEILKMAETKV